MKLIPTKTIKVTEIDFVISDEEIKEGDYFIANHLVWQCGNTIDFWVTPKFSPTQADFNQNQCDKILCQLKSDSPIEGVPICEEATVEELAKETTKKYVNEIEKQTAYLEFISGYTLANKPRGYSEDEMEKAIELSYNKGYEDRDMDIGHGSNLPYCKEVLLSTKIFLLCDDEGKHLRINNTLKFVK